MRRRVLVAAILTILPAAAGAEVNEQGYEIVPVELTTGSSEDIEAGRRLYDQSCAQCHGVEGDGRGTMADRVHPKPRDFTTGSYKLRHTGAGELPTDQDIFDAIAEGLGGTSMPAWEGLLDEAEIWQLVHYIKTFSTDFEEFPPEEQVVIGSPPGSSEESVERGRVLYEEMQCAKCHGVTGRGNGPSAEELKDDAGDKIWPANVTQGWTFRGGSTPKDIYRTFVTGFNGTPMPSYMPSITSEDAWHLVNYMTSLQHELRRDVVVRAVRVPQIPDDPGAPDWADAPYVDFMMAGQIVQEPRLFSPTVDNITLRALYDDDSVALLLTWGDRTENRGDDGRPPDRAGVQFPARAGDGTEKPYFLMGDSRHPVDFWRWSAADGRVATRIAYGMDDVRPGNGAVHSAGGYRDGEYRVVLRRSRTTSDELGVQFEPGAFVPVAFHLWDGANDEDGKRRTISAWYYLLLEPETPRSVFTWPVVAVFFGLGAEIVLLRRLKKRA